MGIKNQKIRQSNDLVESPYAQEFSAHEIKIFEIAAAGITLSDIDSVPKRYNKRYVFTATQLSSLLNTSVSTISHEIEKTASRIMKKTIHLRKVLNDGTVEFEMINIIPYARYKHGVLEFDLNYAIIPYLTEINKNFTEYQLHYLLVMTSSSAIKLYKLLYQYKTIGKRKFTINDLKNQFGVQGKYPQYGPFKKYVVNPSITQINKATDLIVDYNEIKVGRKVEELEFIFKINNKKLVIAEPHTPSKKEPIFESIIDVTPIIESDKSGLTNIEKLISGILYKITKPTIKLLNKYYEEKGEDYIIASINYAEENSKTNFDKYLQDTLKKEWCGLKLIQLAENKVAENKSKIELEQLTLKKEKQNELRKIEIEKIKNEFLNFSIEVRTAIFSELISRVSKTCPEKMDEILAKQEEYTIAFWAIQNNIKYDGTFQLHLKTWLKMFLVG